MIACLCWCDQASSEDPGFHCLWHGYCKKWLEKEYVEKQNSGDRQECPSGQAWTSARRHYTRLESHQEKHRTFVEEHELLAIGRTWWIQDSPWVHIVNLELACSGSEDQHSGSLSWHGEYSGEQRALVYYCGKITYLDWASEKLTRI